jgi:hypothetical protein
MEREIVSLEDIVSRCGLWQLFRGMRPDQVVAGTPKAGLLASLDTHGIWRAIERDFGVIRKGFEPDASRPWLRIWA